MRRIDPWFAIGLFAFFALLFIALFGERTERERNPEPQGRNRRCALAHSPTDELARMFRIALVDEDSHLATC